jgi:hypothetical protein
MSRPCQHLMFVHPDNGVTSEYSIWLDWFKNWKASVDEAIYHST